MNTVVIVTHHFSQIFDGVTVLNLLQNFVFWEKAIYKWNRTTEISTVDAIELTEEWRGNIKCAVSIPCLT